MKCYGNVISLGAPIFVGCCDHVEPAARTTIHPGCRTVYFAAAVSLLAGAILAIHPAIASESKSSPPATSSDKRPAETTGLIAFDIPVQSLASALDAYTIAAHREVLYNGQLALGRRSTRVKGHFTPEAALQLLLEGTRLLPRYMAADAFVLVADDGPLVPTDTASPDVVMRYYGRIQTSLRQAFCTNKRTRPGNYRVAVGFQIGPSGTVSRAALLGSTGDRDLDAMIGKLITGLAIGEPPPRGFAQPVVLMVSPQSDATARDCEATGVRLGGVTP
jgi:TonB C terminal